MGDEQEGEPGGARRRAKRHRARLSDVVEIVVGFGASGVVEIMVGFGSSDGF
jgi:hypothetical protein